MTRLDALDPAAITRLLDTTARTLRDRHGIEGNFGVSQPADGAVTVAFAVRNGAQVDAARTAALVATGDLEAAGYAVTREHANRGPVLVVRPLMAAIYAASAQHAAQVWERAGQRIAAQPADPKRESGRDAADLQYRTWRVEQWVRDTAEADRGSALIQACSALSRQGADRILARHALHTIARSWPPFWARQANGALERDSAASGDAAEAQPVRWVEHEEGRKSAA